MGDAQIAQYLSEGVAGAPQRGQIMVTLLVVQAERAGSAGSPESTPRSIPCSLGTRSRRSAAAYPRRRTPAHNRLGDSLWLE